VAHVRPGDGAVRKVAQRVRRSSRRRSWSGTGMLLGLFVGWRSSPDARGNTTQFRMHLRMSGPCSFLILKSVGDRQPEVDNFAAALERRAEAGIAAAGAPDVRPTSEHPRAES
jgi:hypothetical protein